MRRFYLLPLLAACLPTAVSAADLDVLVHTARGAPVADAVATVESETHVPLPARFAQPLVMTQRRLQFDPFVLVAPVGAEVSFPNEDAVRHQVYSFSPAKTFELRLYGKGHAPAVRFDKAGVVALGCNIHDQMVAFIKVVDAPFAARTDAGGHAVIHGLPPGAAVVHVWHPYMKGAEQTFELSVPRTGGLERTVSMELRSPPLRPSTY